MVDRVLPELSALRAGVHGTFAMSLLSVSLLLHVLSRPCALLMVGLRSFSSCFSFFVLVQLLLFARAEVVPQQDLADLTADDLQLLLSGTGGAITLDRCREVAEFRDMRGPEIKESDPERLAAFSGLMWDALALMQPRELLKLVEFVTAHRTIVKTLIINLVRHTRDPFLASYAVQLLDLT